MTDPTSSYVKKLKDGVVNQVVNDLIIAEDMVWYGSDGATREGLSGWLKDQWSNKIMNVFLCRLRFFPDIFSCRKHTRLYVGMILSPSHKKRVQDNQKLMMFLTSHNLKTLH